MFLLAYDETGLVDSAKSDNSEASDFYSKHMHTHLQVLKYSVHLLIHTVSKKFYKCNIYTKRTINHFKLEMITSTLRLLKTHDKTTY